MNPVADRATVLHRLDGLHHSLQNAARPAGLLGIAELSDLLLPCRPSASPHYLDWTRLTFELDSYLDEVRSLVVWTRYRT